MGQSTKFDERVHEAMIGSDVGPKDVSDRTFSGQALLDGWRFERCAFKGAVLIYSGSEPPQLESCRFEDVRFEFVGAAGRTLAMMQAMSRPSSHLASVIKASFSRVFGH